MVTNDKEQHKPRVRTRARESIEIDVVPPEVFAAGGGFRRRQNQAMNDETGKIKVSSPQQGDDDEEDNENSKSRQGERPTLPSRTESAPSPSALLIHVNNGGRNVPVVNENAAVENYYGKGAQVEHKQRNKDEGFVIIGDFITHSNIVGASDHSSHRRGMMNRVMSDITLNASQHPEPKQIDDIVLSPRSRHSRSSNRRGGGGGFKSPVTSRGKMILKKLYPDFQASPGGGGKGNVTTASIKPPSLSSIQADDRDESFSSVGEYDGFEIDYPTDDDNNGGNNDEADRDDLDAESRKSQSVRASNRQLLTPLAEEEDSEELHQSGRSDNSTKKKKTSFRFSWLTTSTGSNKDRPSNKSTGKKFLHVPKFKQVSSVRRMFLSSMKRRDGTLVAAV